MVDYNIRYADITDMTAIMEFINIYWRKDHILAKDAELFKWQYANDNKLNMVIGVDENSDIAGILGYIPYGEGDNKDICLALWRAKDGAGFLGLQLLIFLMEDDSHRNVFCNGINLKTTALIYERLGYTVTKLNQWYRLLPDMNYKIAKITDSVIPTVDGNNDFSLVRVDSFEDFNADTSDEMFSEKSYPYKSRQYISKRYFNHPAYDYLVYKVVDIDGVANSTIVFRIQEYDGSRAFRVIDFWGRRKDIYNITANIDELAKQCGAEYIDMYEFGLDENNLNNVGWIRVGSNNNIIPNYFAPYSLCNVDINICYTGDSILLFKGDGDQDRPN